MKNVKLIFVLLLMVNCTTESPNDFETSEELTPQVFNCIDDLPEIRITNNGTVDFDVTVYAQDYSQLHSQNLSTTANTGWFQLTNNEVIVVASNNLLYGQKIQLSLSPCENVEIEVDADNVLVLSGV